MAFANQNSERKRRGRLGGGRRQAVEDAHVEGSYALRLQDRRVERDRRRRKGGRRSRHANAVRAGRSGGVDKIDRIDAVTTASLGQGDDVVEDRQAPEIGVLADLVCLQPQLRDAEAADGRRLARVLRSERYAFRSHDLRARAEDDSVRLGIAYFDGNTVTAFWNYAQNFAMNDNAYTDTYGPSTPGAVNVISGQTNGVTNIVGNTSSIPDGQGGVTMIGDSDPTGDTCSSKTSSFSLSGKNIGDLLNAAKISWGSFMGGFDLTATNSGTSTTGCARSTFSSIVGGNVPDYIPHHAWFQYYASTANLTHARPSSVQAIGHTLQTDGKTVDPANHGYDLNDFFAAVSAGNFPAVSYIKLPAFQDGHPGNSDPLDEQTGMVNLINFLQQQPEWKETAVIVTYDNSDGWYDHAFATPTSASYDPTADQVNGPGLCGKGVAIQPQPNGLIGKPVNGRCGPGTRIPLLVISPFAKQNFVSHTRISQASVVRFIEDNWLNGQRIGGGSVDASAGSIMDMLDFGDHDFDRDDLAANKLFLDPTAGTVIVSVPDGFRH